MRRMPHSLIGRQNVILRIWPPKCAPSQHFSAAYDIIVRRDDSFSASGYYYYLPEILLHACRDRLERHSPFDDVGRRGWLNAYPAHVTTPCPIASQSSSFSPRRRGICLIER